MVLNIFDSNHIQAIKMSEITYWLEKWWLSSGAQKVKSQGQVWGRAPHWGKWLESRDQYSRALGRCSLWWQGMESYLGLMLLSSLINLIPSTANKTANKAASNNLASHVYLNIGKESQRKYSIPRLLNSAYITTIAIMPCSTYWNFSDQHLGC